MYSPGNRTPVAAASGNADLGRRAARRPVLERAARATPTATRSPTTGTSATAARTARSAEPHPPLHGTRQLHRQADRERRRGRSDDRDGARSPWAATPPTATIETPADESTYRGGQTITLRGSATDPQDGAVPASRLDWQVRLIHADHVHPVVDRTGVAETSFVAGTDHDSDSYYEITLTATDSSGLRNTKTIQIRPETAAFTLESAPAGAPLSYAGRQVRRRSRPRPRSGSRTTVTAADEFVSGGRRYRFASWSDGGARVHDVTIPATATTLRATYTRRGRRGARGRLRIRGGSRHDGRRLVRDAATPGRSRGRRGPRPAATARRSRSTGSNDMGHRARRRLARPDERDDDRGLGAADLRARRGRPWC